MGWDICRRNQTRPHRRPTSNLPTTPTTHPTNNNRASTISKPAAPAATSTGGSAASGAPSSKKRAAQFPIVKPIFDDVCELQGVTLTRYMMEVSRANPHLTEVESLMNSIQTACKVRRGYWRVGKGVW